MYLFFVFSAMKKKGRVIVGMSGGIDSTIAVHLLQKEGYEVLGATLRLADHYIKEQSKQSRVIERAKAVCDNFGIEHVVADRTREFDNCVVRYFADAYFNGRTPNPCVQCNVFLKWKELLHMADERGIDYVATGHYARVEKYGRRFRLLKGRDIKKDQSYFLWRLNQEELSRTVFPLGDLKKTDVRVLAEELQLPQSGQSESQDICFINDNDYRKFLEEHFPERVKSIGQGTFIDKENTVIGHHGGYHRFTTGQRKGLRIAMGKPVYVRKINPENNSVLITDAAGMEDVSCRITATNWIAMEKPVKNINARVKVRYRNKGVPCRIAPIDGSDYRVDFLETQKAVTPGQSAVFYDNDRVLGGGIIVGPE